MNKIRTIVMWACLAALITILIVLLCSKWYIGLCAFITSLPALAFGWLARQKFDDECGEY